MNEESREQIEREITDQRANRDHDNLEPAEVDAQILDEELAEDAERSEDEAAS